MKKILIVNPFGIGDVLFTTPLIYNLKKNLPDAFLGYICNKRTKEILSNNPDIDKIYVYEKDDYRFLWRSSKLIFLKKLFLFFREIKNIQYDMAIDLSLGQEYGFFLKLTKIKERVGYNYKNRGIFLTKKIDLAGYERKHMVEYYLDIIIFLNFKIYDDKLKIYLNKEDAIWSDRFLSNNGIMPSDLVIGLIPGGGASWGPDAYYKHWMPENFAKIADELAKGFNTKILIMGDKSEKPICQKVADSMKTKYIMASFDMSLNRFSSLISKCNLIICNDGGPLHIAVACGIKTVSIFGPVDEKVYGPYPKNDNLHKVIKANIKCRPCYRKFKYAKCKTRECILKVDYDVVLNAAKNLLGLN